MAPDIDCLVVGAGCAGAMVAQTLVEAGRSVTVVDVGFTSEAAAAPDGDYLDLRAEDPEQSRYLIGDDASGVQWGTVVKGEHVTPPRRHLMHRTAELLPVAPGTFDPLESLGYGGLGIGWGLGSWQFSDSELQAAGMDPTAMRDAYRVVNRRIGISGAMDDVGDATLDSGDIYQAAPDMDRNHAAILARYRRRRRALQASGFRLGRAPLALLTADLGDRSAHAYRDLDFYADHGHSTFRPWMVLDRLRREQAVDYRSGLLALRFAADENVVALTCRHVDSGASVTIRAKTLVLAAGALGSARLVLRSQRVDRLPLLCNPYSVIPGVQPRFFGAPAERHKLGMSQLSLLHDDNRGRGVSLGSLYSYQSLMLFRILRQVPIAMADARVLLGLLAPAFMICGVFQPDAPAPDKWLELGPDPSSISGDRLVSSWAISETEQAQQADTLRQFKRALRRLGVLPLKVVQTTPGASIHYGGTVPFSTSDRVGTLAPDGRLHGTDRVFVADGSGFGVLPGKGPTWSIMANAHRTASVAAGAAS